VYGEPELCRSRTRPPWWISRSVFPSIYPSIAPAEMSNTPCRTFSPLEDNQWGGCRLDIKKPIWEFFQRIFALGIFLGGVSRYAAPPLIFVLSQGHNDITRFCSWSAIAPDRKWFESPRKNSKICSDYWHRWIFWSSFRISWPTSRRASTCPNLREWWNQPAHLSCPVAQLLI